MTDRFDEIAVVETMYDLSAPRDEWLREISLRVASNLGASRGCLTVQHRLQPDGFYQHLPIYVDTAPEIAAAFSLAMTPFAGIDSKMYEHLAGRALRGFVETFPVDDPYRLACAPHLERCGVKDTNLLRAFDTAAHLVTLSPFFAREATPTPTIRARYERLAAHLAAAIRLRRQLESNSPNAAEAVFDANGRSCDARGDARSSVVLEELRGAIRARDKARASLRREDPDKALRMWTALVRGRWSLLDRFESDGRRYVVALSNQNTPRDPRALTPREEQSAQLAGLGAPNGEIAYALGVTSECVSTHVHSALRKLGCRSRRDLIRMMKDGSHEFTLDIHGNLIAVLAEPPLSQPGPASLTPAERKVFSALQAGKTNAEIASALGTSARTVANQVAAILRKTRATSRYELMRGSRHEEAPANTEQLESAETGDRRRSLEAGPSR